MSRKEAEKAIYGMVEYRFKPNYKHLEIKSSQWFKMTQDQCKKLPIKFLGKDVFHMNHLLNNRAHQESFRPQIFDCQYNLTNQELPLYLLT